MSAGFDEICRVIASPISRRTAMRVVVGIAAGGLFAFSPRRVIAAGPCQRFPEEEGCPGMNRCGDDPRQGGTILCCPPGTRCCYNFTREKCQCCVGTEVCCQDTGGINSGICCQNAASCCATAAGVVQACCGEFEECCQNVDGTSSGVCCDTGNGFCCRNPTTGIAHACCRDGPPRQVCCSEGFCCVGTGPAVCCGHSCCPAAKPECCDDRVGFCCASEEGCCPGALPAHDRCCPAGTECCHGAVPKCCLPHQTCCVGPGGAPTDCCEPDQLCINGICNHVVLVHYTGRGSAKAVLDDGSVSIIRFEIAGTGAPIPPDSFGDADNITGSLQAFNYATRTLIDSVRFSSVQGRRSAGGDVFIIATGSVRANGQATNMVLIATKSDGIVTFDIRNRDTGVFLAGGTGETGRADLRLTVTT